MINSKLMPGSGGGILPPVWVTAIGSLGAFNAGTALSIQLRATDPQGQQLKYALTAGALPQGIVLSTKGLISGILPVVSGDTTSSFTVTVSNRKSGVARAFSLTDLAVSAPTPTTLTITPATATIFDNTLSGTRLATYATTMSDNSPFTGQVTITSPASGFKLESPTGNSAIDTAQLLTAGSYTVALSAAANGGTATASLALTVSTQTAPVPYISGSTYYGTAGDDTFTVIVSPWVVTTINGLGGVDTVIWPYDYSWYAFVQNSDGSVQATDVHATGQAITCVGITTFQFLGGFTISVAALPFSTAGTGGGGGGGSSGGGGTSGSTVPLLPTAPVTGSSTHLTVTVTFGDGTIWNFAEDSAVEMGDYVDPAGAFTQHCRLHAPLGIPMMAWFRPDASGLRDEVILELGQQGIASVSDRPAYTAVIKRSGSTLHTTTVSVPTNIQNITTTSAHYWGSRWRYQSAARPVRKTPADLIAAKQIVHYDGTLVKGDSPSGSTYSYTPMCFSSVGLFDYFPSTGERDDIGLVTEITGEWLCTASSNSLNNLLAQAEAAASVPWHFRDETGAPVSIVNYPSAGCFWSQSAGGNAPWFQTAGALAATTTDGSGNVTPYVGTVVSADRAHTPSLCYIAFLITGDPYYLEELQFQANYHLLDYNVAYRNYAQGLQSQEQTRGFAWAIRDLIGAMLSTPASVPAWLLTKGYWSTIVGNNAQWFNANFVNGPRGDPLIDALHFCIDVSPDHIAPWQQDFLTTVLGWAVNAGATWGPQQVFQAVQAIGRADNLTGYPRSQATWYYYMTSGVIGFPTLASVNGIVATGSGNYPPGVDVNYSAYVRGALALATLLGNANAAGAFTYTDGQCTINNYLPYKWAFRSTA